jgi:hypothetical protein
MPLVALSWSDVSPGPSAVSDETGRGNNRFMTINVSNLNVIRLIFAAHP